MADTLLNDALMGAIVGQGVYVVGTFFVKGKPTKNRKARRGRRRGGAIGGLGNMAADVVGTAEQLPIVGSLLGTGGGILAALLNPFPGIAGAVASVGVKYATNDAAMGIGAAALAGGVFLLFYEPTSLKGELRGKGSNGLLGKGVGGNALGKVGNGLLSL